MESSLVDYTWLQSSDETVGGWVETLSDTVGSWGKWFAGSNPPAPAPEVELQTFSGQINELPEDQRPLLGGEEEVQDAPWGLDEDLPGGTGEFEGLGIPDLEAPPPEFGSEAYIQGLKEREVALREAMGADMGETEMVSLGESIGSSAEVFEAAEIVGEAVEATTAGIIGGVALGALGAAAMIGATIGVQELQDWLYKKKRVYKEKDDDPWMGYVGYFVVGRIWYPMIVDLVSHDHKIVTIQWKDMTGFTRYTNVNRSARLL